MGLDLVEELKAAAENAYNPSWGWDTLAQPVRGLDVETYLDLAAQGTPALQKQLAAFCKQQDLSYIFISPDAYNQSYEHGRLGFREWLDDYCQQHGLDSRAQVAIVGPCVKPFESATLKNELDPAERIKDYSRALYIFLNDSPHKAARERSLNAMGDAIMAVESEPAMALGRKNSLYKPKSNGYRDYKSIWRTTIPDDQLFAGESILSEVKFEPECVQDLNRMTRRFMGITRQTMHEALPDFYKRCASVRDTSDRRTASSNYSRLDARIDLLNGFSRVLYDKVFKEEGFDRFLNKKLLPQHSAPTKESAHALAKKFIEEFGKPPERDREVIMRHLPNWRPLGANLILN
ncbi:MAG: hypothetical protein WC989_09130 [Micavibrio sp.]